MPTRAAGSTPMSPYRVATRTVAAVATPPKASHPSPEAIHRGWIHAGPVGEALIMTAAGLAVALPAVFAYNAFTRANRVVLADLDAFAHDLHAFFTVGKPFVANSAQIHPMRARAATEAA